MYMCMCTNNNDNTCNHHISNNNDTFNNNNNSSDKLVLASSLTSEVLVRGLAESKGPSGTQINSRSI